MHTIYNSYCIKLVLLGDLTVLVFERREINMVSFASTLLALAASFVANIEHEVGFVGEQVDHFLGDVDNFLANDVHLEAHGHHDLANWFENEFHLGGSIPKLIKEDIEREGGRDAVHYVMPNGHGETTDIYRFIGKDGKEHEIVTGTDGSNSLNTDLFAIAAAFIIISSLWSHTIWK